MNKLELNIGDKTIAGNPENIMSLRILEVVDICEISRTEGYFEIEEKPLIKRIKNLNNFLLE